MYKNPVLEMYLNMKNDYVQQYGKSDMWDCVGNTIQYWANCLADAGFSKYQDMIAPLTINEYDGFALFKYNDLGVDFDAYDGLYRECRSVVIDMWNDCIALLPFRKFFNVGEREETSLYNIKKLLASTNDIEITEKLDGSMQSYRWYGNRVVGAGSQALDASKSFRLREGYVWANAYNIREMLQVFPNFTFIFEYISEQDPHIVKYDAADCGLRLIGMRNVYTGIEMPYEFVIATANSFGVKTTKAFNMTFSELQEEISRGKRADEAEGFVLSIGGRKFKMKYDDYCHIHKAIGKMLSPNYIIDSIRNDYWDDFYSKIPTAYQPQAKEIAGKVFAYAQIIGSKVYEYANIVGLNKARKEFMIEVDKNVPLEFRGYVRSYYLYRDFDVLKSVKMTDINIVLKEYNIE